MSKFVRRLANQGPIYRSNDKDNSYFALLDDAVHGLDVSTIHIPVHFEVFDKFAIVDALLELFQTGEVIVLAMFLAFPGRPGRMANTHSKQLRMVLS